METHQPVQSGLLRMARERTADALQYAAGERPLRSEAHRLVADDSDKERERCDRTRQGSEKAGIYMRIVQLCQVLQTKEKGAEISVCCMHPTSKGFFYLELKITKANKKTV